MRWATPGELPDDEARNGLRGHVFCDDCRLLAKGMRTGG